MKALAFQIDGKNYCCACAEHQAVRSGCPHLFLELTGTKDLVKVDGDTLCPLCGYRFGGHDAQMAAVRICVMIDGGEVE